MQFDSKKNSATENEEHPYPTSILCFSGFSSDFFFFFLTPLVADAIQHILAVKFGV